MKTKYLLLSFLFCSVIAFSQRGWIIQNSGVEFILNDVWFVDELNGWAVGESNLVLHTSNGGATWEQQNSGSSIVNKHWSVQFLDASNGWVSGSDVKLYHTTDGGASVEEPLLKPFQLLQNTPNPVMANTTFRFELNQQGIVKLTLFDGHGGEIITILDKEIDAGEHLFEWDSRAANLPAGIYYYRLETLIDGKQFTETKKMVVL